MVEISDKEFQRLAVFIKDNFGIHLSAEKKVLVVGRLGHVLQKLNMNSFTDYINYVAADKNGEAARTFINHMTTNHTFFMREADHFKFLKNIVLPRIVPSIKDRDLRVWSAGCSTGEEAYTLAMLIHDFYGNMRLGWDTKLLATDISDKVLAQAVKGIYTDEAINSLPRGWKMSYFKPKGPDHYEVAAPIKNEVIFRRFNLMDPFPFKKKFHVIFCRNVMIYFDASTRKRLLNKFYDSLEPGGYLFIGHSETITRDDTYFKYVMPAVYRKE
ncbi:CheR family methyltransferase [Paenibacillus xylaniclasticus]|uniref:CheR family methyltransferase n=1 Tax=Paenibacillus xylaniclasticus TaxID=588083 RepID=UPI000FD778CA|nr:MULTISPECIES: protein-glutamate O-methyltransferase CheR [Paenibacillus]GFN30458.1 chemotaxis protein CheR [Paenibacillus curdlanolyticus]